MKVGKTPLTVQLPIHDHAISNTNLAYTCLLGGSRRWNGNIKMLP